MSTVKDARGKKIAYAYDSLNRKLAAYDNQLGGTQRAEWIYDSVAKGHLSQSNRIVGQATYQRSVLTYNDSYQPEKTQYIIPASETGLAGTYNYNTTYNIDGSIKSTSLPGTNTGLPDEKLAYGYNAFGAPTTLSTLYGNQNLTYIEGTNYNALGEVDQIGRYLGSGGHVYTAYTREPDTGRLTSIRTDRNATAPYNTISDTRYEYTPAGDITKAVDLVPDPVDDTQCYRYDQLSRLTEAWTPTSGDCTAAPSTATLGGPAAYWNTWQYDAIGNRTKQTVHSASGDATTDYTYPTPGVTAVRPHAVTTTTGASPGSYTYDASGNTLTRPTASSGTQTMTWNVEGELETSTDSTGQTTYLYDADGNRLIRRDPTGRTLYLPAQEIRYTTATTATAGTRYYAHGAATIASRTPTSLTWLSSDQQGTAQLAVDVGTQQATLRRQTPFGTPRGTAVTWPNDKGFVGGTNDNTGLTHLGAREYDASLGRFISVDPIHDLGDPQQWNAYSYAGNSPVTHADPTGLKTDMSSSASDTAFATSPGIAKARSKPTRKAGPSHPPGHGDRSTSILDTPVDIPNGLKDALSDWNYNPEEYTVGTLSAFAAKGDNEWKMLCGWLAQNVREECSGPNPYTAKSSMKARLLGGGITVLAVIGTLACGVAIEACFALAVDMASGEASFAATGSMFGASGFATAYGGLSLGLSLRR